MPVWDNEQKFADYLSSNTGDAINGTAINTAFAVPGSKTATFYCAVPGQWHSVLSV